MIDEKKNTKGFYNWSYLILLTASIVVINIIAANINFKLDMTEDDRYSLAKETTAFLSDPKNFENRVSLQIYLEGNLPSEIQTFRNAVEDKLKDFKYLCGDRLEYVFINPSPEGISMEDQKERNRQYYNQGKGIFPLELAFNKDGGRTQMMLWPGAVVSYSSNGIIKETRIQFLPGSRSGNPLSLNGISETLENALNNLEYNLISAIRKITQVEKPRIAWIQGHGELNEHETVQARRVLDPYYSMDLVNMNGQIAALDDFDGAIIANPQKPYSDKDRYIVDQFLMRGGKLMVFMNALRIEPDSLLATGFTPSARKNIGLETMLFDYGIKINENFVIDNQCEEIYIKSAKISLLPWKYSVLAGSSEHPIARNVEPVILNYTNELQLIEMPGLKLSKILQSSSNSNRTGLVPEINLKEALTPIGALNQSPEDPNNRLTLAALAEGRFKSHFKNRVNQEYSGKYAKKLMESSKPGKVMVVGNGTFLKNSCDSALDAQGKMRYRYMEFNELKLNPILLDNPELYQSGHYHVYGNQEFLQNLVDYTMGENSLLGLRSKQIDIKEIDKEKVSKYGHIIKYINLLLPLLIVAFMALFLISWRKRKYQRP